MSSENEKCPDCGAVLPPGETCRAYFDQMLYWETEEPSRWAVHHLMVLCYHLQHPHFYSPETLAGAQHMLVNFLEGGVTTDDDAAADARHREFRQAKIQNNRG